MTTSSPYRANVPPAPPEPAERVAGGPLEMVVLGGLFWLASVVRVAGAFAHHEAFGAEASLACFVGLALPGYAAAALVEAWRRGRAASPCRSTGARHGRDGRSGS